MNIETHVLVKSAVINGATKWLDTPKNVAHLLSCHITDMPAACHESQVMLQSGMSAWLELFVVGRVSKPYLIILQGDQWWGVKWRTGGVLTWHFLIQNTAGNPKSFSQASTLALLRSQWSFSVHWAEVIRFPTHTVSTSVNDISSDRAHNIETEKGVIVIENIACGCSYQWHPPSMHSCMHS